MHLAVFEQQSVETKLDGKILAAYRGILRTISEREILRSPLAKESYRSVSSPLRVRRPSLQNIVRIVMLL